MSEGQTLVPKLVRYPLIPLNWEDRNDSFPKEILVDYTNSKVYIKKEDGSGYLDLTSGLIGNIGTDEIVVNSDGQTMKLTDFLNNMLQKVNFIDDMRDDISNMKLNKADINYISYIGNTIQIPNTVAGEVDKFTLNGETKITKATLIFTTNTITTTGVDFGGFVVGDVVSITNCAISANNKVAKITAVAAKVLTFAAETFTAGTETDSATITRIVNIVANGNFINTNTLSASTGSSHSVVSNVLTNTGTGGTNMPMEVQTLPVTAKNTRKYYIRSGVRVTNANCDMIQSSVDTSSASSISIKIQSSPVQNTWYNLSNIITWNNNYETENLRIKFIHNYADAAASNTKSMEINYNIGIDMGLDSSNPLFGKTLAEMDALFTGWVSETPMSYSIGVSPDNPQYISSIGGKNIFNYNSQFATPGKFSVTGVIENFGGIITKDTALNAFSLLGDAWAAMYFDYIPVKPNTNYRTSYNILSGSLGADIPALYDINKNFIGIADPVSGKSFKTPASCAFVRLSIQKSTIVEFKVSDIQFEEGLNATTPEPYRSIRVYNGGSNILKYPYSDPFMVTNGITFVDNKNGTITLNGTATADATWNYGINFMPLTKNIITFSGGSTNSGVTQQFDIYDGTTYKTTVTLSDTNMTVTKDLTSYSNPGCKGSRIRVISGTVVNNITLYPKIEIGSTSTEYSRYMGNIYAIPLKDTSGNYLQPLSVLDSDIDTIVKINDKWFIHRFTGSRVLKGDVSEGWTYNSAWSPGDHAGFYVSIPDKMFGKTNVITSPFKTKYLNTLNEEAVFGETATFKIYIVILKSRISPQDLTGIQSWLKANPVTVLYKLATPIYQELHQDTQDILNAISKTYDGQTVTMLMDNCGSLEIGYNPIRSHINTSYRHLESQEKRLIQNLPTILDTKYDSPEDVLGASMSISGLNAARADFGACGIQDAALAFGGWNGTTKLAITEKFNTTIWSNTGNLNTARNGLAGCGIQDAGLGIGGTDSAYALKTVIEKFDGSTWVNKGNLVTARMYLAACGVSDAAIAFGGYVSSPVANTEKFDGTVCTNKGNLNIARKDLAGCGTLYAALAFGGYSTVNAANTEKFNGTVWSNVGYLNTARTQLSGCGLQNVALAFGGYVSGPVAITEKFNGDVWSNTGSLSVARHSLDGCGTQNNGLAFGGYGTDYSTLTEIFNKTIWKTAKSIQDTMDSSSSKADVHSHKISDVDLLQQTLDAKLNLTGGTLTGALTGTDINATNINATNVTATKVTGGVWNDYAEYRQSLCPIKAGMVVTEDTNDNSNEYVIPSKERLCPNPMVVSDTFGFSIGEQQIPGEFSIPIAVAGRVLVYTDTHREFFKKNDVVCSGVNGTVSKMTEEEIVKYPDRILGIVSSVPNYIIWGRERIMVNGRIWIKIK